MQNRRVTGWVICLLVILAVARAVGQEPAPAAAGGAAFEVVQRLHRALVAASELGDFAERRDVLAADIRATHDLDAIARLTIRREIREFSTAEQTDYVAAFAALSIATYAARFTGVAPDSFRLGEPLDAGTNRIQVPGFVRTGAGEEIPLDYLLQRTSASSQDWLIVNVVADGVSDLALKRAEYAAILRDGTPADLVSELARQTAALGDGVGAD